MRKEPFYNLSFLTLVIVAFYLFFRIMSPFIPTLAWAAILTILFYPIFKRITRLFRDRRDLAAIAMTSVVIIVIVLPSGFLLNLIAMEMIDIYQYCEQFIQEGRHIAFLEALGRVGLFQRIWETLDNTFDLSQVNINTILLENFRKLSLYMAGQGSKFI